MIKKVFLVFQGGGAKGIAHIGGLAAWEEIEQKFNSATPGAAESMELAGVAGTSAGAMIASLVAAGYKAEGLYKRGPNPDHLLKRVAGGSYEKPSSLFGRMGWFYIESLRVAEKIDGQWVTHQWLKKAVLLSFRINDNQVIDGAESRYFDKVPMKFADYDEARFQKEGFRVVPPAAVRQGAFIARNTVLMPSYVNIGAYVDEGTMVDTWATVGSCAQIGKNVHLSGGVGIGGVLEPLQANPTIIEDNCFIGARSEVVEGVIVEEG